MLRVATVLVLAATLSGCSTTSRIDQAAAADAIRFGLEACERHFFDGAPIEQAIAASANGRTFEPVTRAPSDWPYDPAPWRIAGVDVWVGLSSDASKCEVMALDSGGLKLRDAIMSEHVARTDRVWKVWETGGSGRKAVCTVDRVPDAQSILVWSIYDEMFTENRASEFNQAPPHPIFQVVVVKDDVCSRDFYG